MAGIIPRGSQQTRLSSSAPVSIASTSDARIGGEALASFGRGVQAIGTQLVQEQQKQDALDRKLTEDEKANEIESVVKQSTFEAKRLGAADGSDINTKYKEIVGPKIAEVIDSVGDERTRKNLQSYSSRLDVDANTTLGIESLGRKEEYNFNRIGKIQEQNANQIRETPTEAMAQAKVAQLGADINNIIATGAVGPENAAKLREAGLNTYANQWMEGLATKKQFGKALNLLRANADDPSLVTEMTPAQASQMGLIDPSEQSALESKGETFKLPISTAKNKVKLSPEVTAVMNAMTPKEKARWIDQFDAKIREETEIRMADLNADINGFTSYVQRGGQADPKKTAELKQNIVNSNLPTTAKMRKLDELNTAEAIGAQVQLASMTPRGKEGNLLENARKAMELSTADAAKFDSRFGEMGKDFASINNREQALGALSSAITQMRKQQDEDGAGFVLRDQEISDLYRGSLDGNAETSQKYVEKSMIKQNYLGIPGSKIRAIPKAVAQEKAGKFALIQDSAASALEVEKLQSQYGKHFPKVMAEIVRENPSLSHLQVAAFVGNPMAKESIIENSKNKKAINEAFTTDLFKPAKDNIETSVNDYVNDINRATINANPDGGSLALSQTMTEQVMLEAKKSYIQDPTQKTDTVAQKAYDKILGSTFAVAQSKNSSVIVPRKISGVNIDEKLVKAYMDTSTDYENIKNENIGIPAAYKEAFGAEAKNRFARDISAKGIWVPNSSQDGMYLAMPTANGRVAVQDAYGKPYEKSFLELTEKPNAKAVEKLKRTTSIQLINNIKERQSKARQPQEVDGKKLKDLLGMGE